MTDHFAALNEPRRPWLDAETLKEKFHTLSGTVHPDRVHGADEATRHLAGDRYAALNAAYQCLRDPKLRLQHLLCLERGAKPGDLKSIPEDVVQLFAAMGALLRQADALIAERSQSNSPMVKVQVLGKSLPCLDKISEMQSALNVRRATLLEELRALDDRWSRRSQGTPPTDADLATAEKLYHLFGFVDRWAAQLQERMVGLTL